MTKMTFQKLDLNKKAKGERLESQTTGKPLEVQFNPTEYSLSTGNQFAEIAIPGLDSPVLQFVRGNSEKITLELFFDTTDDGTGSKAKSVTEKTDPFYRFVKIDPKSHAPAVYRLTWGKNFPNTSASYDGKAINVFDCVVESVDRKFTLFNSDGVPLRATITLKLKQYKTLEEQLKELNLQSSDHTRVHIVRQGETLPQIAYAAYEDPSQWRLIADHNRLLNPRKLAPGTVLELPPTG